jgi:ribosomal protein L11 methyltransferase
METTELVFDCADEATRELLIALLANMGYDGFEETETQLKAYTDKQEIDENKLNNICNEYSVKYCKSIIQKENWNAVWESGFSPVQVDDFVGVRAAFHPPFTNVAHELVITPKMSFGTGHHATTWLVMQMMRGIGFRDKTVFDFGTGTGILAILASRLGAASVLAVDNDDWCIENASENILLNHVQNVHIQKDNAVNENNHFDIVIANINRNIILDNLQAIAGCMREKAILLLSGLLVSDEADILAACSREGLVYRETRERNGWIAIDIRKALSSK